MSLCCYIPTALHSPEAEGAASGGPQEGRRGDEGEEGERDETERSGPETAEDPAGQPQIPAEMERERH